MIILTNEERAEICNQFEKALASKPSDTECLEVLKKALMALEDGDDPLYIKQFIRTYLYDIGEV